MSPPTYTISRDFCENLLWSADECGLDIRPLRDLIDEFDRAARLPMAVFESIWQHLLAQDCGFDLGLRLGSRFRLGRLGLVEHLAVNSATFGEALQRGVDYWKLVADDDKVITLDRGKEQWRISFLSSLPHPRAAYEVDTSYVLQFFKLLLGRPPLGLQVGLIGPCPGPDHALAYREHFGCPVAFGQDTNWIAVAAQATSSVLPSALAATRTVIVAEADLAVRTLTRKVAIARQVERLVEMGALELAQVARHLKLSERSLQRKLEMEGVSFSEIRDRARRKRLQQLLAEPNLAVKEVAYLLGYEERGLFEACARWFGVTPAVLRLRLLDQ